MSNEQGSLHWRPDVVLNEQGSLHFSRRMWVRKLVQKCSIRFATLTPKSIEEVDTMIQRRINIMCLQETKWVGVKALARLRGVGSRHSATEDFLRWGSKWTCS